MRSLICLFFIFPLLSHAGPGGIENLTQTMNSDLFEILKQSQIKPLVKPGSTPSITYRLYDLTCIWEPASDNRVWCEYYDRPKFLFSAQKFFDDGYVATFSGQLLKLLKDLPVVQGTSGALAKILICTEFDYGDSKDVNCEISVPISEDK